MEKHITCIICPIGCEITITLRDGEIIGIEGHQCEEGEEYAIQEILNPVRTITTSLKVRGGTLPLVSVKTDQPIPKEQLFEIMDVISDVEIEAPIKIGDVLVQEVQGNPVNIVATKNVKKKNK